MTGFLIAFLVGIGIAILARPLAIVIKSLLKDIDIRKMVSVTAYYGAGIWTSLINALANAVVSMSFKPILTIMRNPLAYYDLQLVAGDFIIGLVGFATWFMTVFAFYALLVRKVAESVGVKIRARYVVAIATPFTLLFLYAFGFRNSIYIAFFTVLPYLIPLLGGLVIIILVTKLVEVMVSD